MRDLYDWLRFQSRTGGMRRVKEDELPPPAAPRYEQLADILRRRIFDGTFPEAASGPGLARDYGISQTGVQRAFEILAREGLLRMTSGSRTVPLERQRWRVGLQIRLPLDDAARDHTFAEIAVTLGRIAAGHPAVTEASADRSPFGVSIALMIESADLPGATTAALGVIRQAAGSLPIVAMTADEAAK